MGRWTTVTLVGSILGKSGELRSTVCFLLPSLFCETSFPVRTPCHSHRHGLFEDLCPIHEKGVMHSDLRRSNVAISDDSKPCFIDSSHSRLHDCEGPGRCEELIKARMKVNRNV